MDVRVDAALRPRLLQRAGVGSIVEPVDRIARPPVPRPIQRLHADVAGVPEEVRAHLLTELDERRLAALPREVPFVDAPGVEIGRERCRHVEILAAHHQHERLGREQRLATVIEMEMVVA